MSNKITVADSRLINWLLYESGISRYAISRDVDISESTLSRIVNGSTSIEHMRFGYAHKLTAYAKELQADIGNNGKRDDSQ